MKSKTVVITGALTGIGFDCAKVFAREGYNVIFSGRDVQRGESRLKELCTISQKVLFVSADVTNEKQVASLLEKAINHYGTLDVVIHSAGTEGNPAPLENLSADDFNNVFNTNVLSTMLIMKHALPIMRAQRYGSLINISSQAGLVGMPGRMVYAASKSAVNSLTQSAALEVAASGVRVNAIAPGPVATDMFERFTGRDHTAKQEFLDMFPTGRVIEIEEISAAALYLASDVSRSVVGEIMKIDGGYTAG